MEHVRIITTLNGTSGICEGGLPSVVVPENGNVVVQTVAPKPVTVAQTCACEDAVFGISSIRMLLRRDRHEAACKQREDGDTAEGR